MSDQLRLASNIYFGAMFKPPWLRLKTQSAVINRDVDMSQSVSARAARSRSPHRPCSTSASVAELANSYAKTLRVCANSLQDRLPARSLEDIQNAIRWLSGLASTEPHPLLHWRYVVARMQLYSARPAAQVHTALNLPVLTISGASGRAGPTPRFNIFALQQFASEGGDINAILDNIFIARTGTAHSEGTYKTYGSRLHMIGWACEILDQCPLPATLITIQRVTSIVNDASTLRSWLATWRLAHTLVGLPWNGDLDPRFRLIRLGLTRLAPPPLPRKRARLQQTIAIVLWALARESRRWHLWAGLAAMSYTRSVSAYEANCCNNGTRDAPLLVCAVMT